MLVDPVRDWHGPGTDRRRVLRGDDLLYGTTLGFRARLQPNQVMHIERDVVGTGAGFRLSLSLPCTSAGGAVE
jgi:hypothetical protein